MEDRVYAAVEAMETERGITYRVFTRSSKHRANIEQLAHVF